MINKQEFIKFIEDMNLKTLEELKNYIEARIENKIRHANDKLERVFRQ